MGTIETVYLKPRTQRVYELIKGLNNIHKNINKKRWSSSKVYFHDNRVIYESKNKGLVSKNADWFPLELLDAFTAVKFIGEKNEPDES